MLLNEFYNFTELDKFVWRLFRSHSCKIKWLKKDAFEQFFYMEYCNLMSTIVPQPVVFVWLVHVGNLLAGKLLLLADNQAILVNVVVSSHIGEKN
jgi:hypothetical protein